MTPSFPLQFDDINAAALRLYPGLLYQWFPGGVLHGDEYTVLNPSRTDASKGSFKINTTTGFWADFATNQRGRTPISLYAEFFTDDRNYQEAATQIARQIGMLNDCPPDPAIARLMDHLKNHPNPEVDRSFDAGWEQIPASVAAGPPLIPANCPTWTYFTMDGQVLGYVSRRLLADGKKSFLPTTCWRNADGKEVWRHKGFTEPRPIYNRLALAGAEAALIVEGEKAADAGAFWFPDVITISWPGGAQAVGKVDWSELRGKAVALLPDHDEPGRAAMRTLAAKLMTVGCKSIYVGTIPDDYPDGWDIADNTWADHVEAKAWLDGLTWTKYDVQASDQVNTPKTPQDERLERAIARGGSKTWHTPQAVPLMPVEPLPIPLLAQLEADLNRRVHIAHPLAAQQVALAVAAHACARQGKSTSNDPCSLSLALCSQSIGMIRPYLEVVFRLFESADLRASVRQTRISTTNSLYKLLYLNPALLYLSAEYGGMVKFARRQPAGSLEQALNTMAELYGAADVSVDMAEIGIKGFDEAGQNVLRSPTLNLLALLSQDDMAAVVKASELGRGALEQLQVVVLDEDRLVLNDPDDVIADTTPFDPALVAMIRRLRRLDQPLLSGGQGYQCPELSTVRWGADMKTVYPALTALTKGATRAARPLLIAARANIRRVCTVLAMWANLDAPVITPDLLAWANRREINRLTTFLAQFDLLQSDDGKTSAYQKVLQAIQEAKHHGITLRELHHNCWTFRSMAKDKRDECIEMLVDDGEVVGITPEGKRATAYFGIEFVKTEGATS